MSEIKLQVGKTYLNRKGEEVKIIRNDNKGRYPFQGDNGQWYTENGKWGYLFNKLSNDLIEEVEEVPEPRHTFDIPDGVKKVTVEQVGNRIVVEMVPEKEPKPGDVMINKHGSVYIFKRVIDNHSHEHYVWLGKDGNPFIKGWCNPGRPATPEEAQPLFDALKKAGKRWNPETMQVEEITEIDHIREWVEENLNDVYYSKQCIAKVIGYYLKHREGEK